MDASALSHVLEPQSPLYLPTCCQMLSPIMRGCAAAWRIVPKMVSTAVLMNVHFRPKLSPRTPNMIWPVSAPRMVMRLTHRWVSWVSGTP